MDSKDTRPKIAVICGPTGIGKTAVSIPIAQNFPVEIISADSMQVYRHMNIGTAKPTADEQKHIPHHMIDILDPDEPFDAAQFSEMAREKIAAIHDRGSLPLVVGGTGLYIKSLIHGLFQTPATGPEIRGQLKANAAIHGINSLHRRLQQHDPETAARLHPHDTYRIIRALEVYEATGNPLSRYHREHRFREMPFKVLKIGLQTDRSSLYDRIDRRVDEMIREGFLEEVKHLLGMGYSETLKSMQAIGYRHMVDFIKGSQSWDETIRTIKRDTRRFAKRQLTWFRADSEIIWIAPSALNDIQRLIKHFLDDI
jgi:tRNA dimethylallyltransferase